MAILICMLEPNLATGWMQAVEQPYADADRVAAVGYCFGGGGIINLMRTYPNVTDGLLGKQLPCLLLRAQPCSGCKPHPAGLRIGIFLKLPMPCETPARGLHELHRTCRMHCCANGLA